MIGTLINLVTKRIEARRQAQYIESTRNWPTAAADVVEWQAVSCPADSDEPDKFQVQATLGLTQGDRRIYGVLRSVGMVHGEARNLVKSGQLPTHVTVRYDPADLGEMIAAPQPGELPFEVRLD